MYLYSNIKRIIMGIILAGFLMASGLPSHEAQFQEMPLPMPMRSPVDAEAKREQVWVQLKFENKKESLKKRKRTFLKVGDGVDVDRRGRAILRFDNAVTVEVMRNGEFKLEALKIETQSLVLRMWQRLGVFFTSLHSYDKKDLFVMVETDFAIVTATGTQFLIVRESKTPLEWVIVLEADEDVQVTSKATGVTVPVSAGWARWIAPIGDPSPPIAYDQQAVEQWLESWRAGGPESEKAEIEIGEVLWPHADILANTPQLTGGLPAPSEPFLLDEVVLTLDPAGVYKLEDCNGDGVKDIAIQNGKLQMDFRSLLARVRALDVTLLNRNGPNTLKAFDPAKKQIDQTSSSLDNQQTQLLSLRSEPGEPYHYAELSINNGCFLSLGLTLPTTTPTVTRTVTWPDTRIRAIVTPTATPPEPSVTPSVTPPEPTITPSVTPSVTPPEPTITPIVTPTVTPSVTPSVTPPEPTITPSVTPSVTPTATPTATPIDPRLSIFLHEVLSNFIDLPTLTPTVTPTPGPHNPASPSHTPSPEPPPTEVLQPIATSTPPP
ncbi:MAG: hypothetical protein ACPGWR_17110 [Ardenticatenaceae bacterium]